MPDKKIKTFHDGLEKEGGWGRVVTKDHMMLFSEHFESWVAPYSMTKLLTML